jgi:hypothetical protein
LLTSVRIDETPLGIEKTEGMCKDRVQTVLDEETILEALASGRNKNNRTEYIETGSDEAFLLSSQAVLSVNTGQVFPEGWPTDFSVVGTFKSDKGRRGVLFSIYNDAGDEQFALEVGDTLNVLYQVFIATEIFLKKLFLT